MQSQQDTTDAEAIKRYGHRRTPTLGKAMPVTSLLLNCPPPTMSTLRSSYMRDGRTPDEERPPLFFPLESNTSSVPTPQLETKPKEQQMSNTKPSAESPHSSSDEINLEQDYDLLVSECSSGNGDGDRSRNEPRISLVGNSIFYTPCLTCTDSAPDDMSARATAINEMCRRLCTDECRLRLSLAGFEPPSTLTLKSREALEEYVKEATCLQQQENQQRPQLQHTCSEDTMCAESLEGLARQEVEQQQQSVDEVDRAGVAVIAQDEDISSMHNQVGASAAIVKTSPPTARPPSCIAIQRKKFLTDILMANANDTDSDSSFADEQKELGKDESLKPTAATRVTVEEGATLTASDHPVDDKIINSTKVDQHALAMLKDFREKFEIAEALAKTSAMTSTTQMKQRLAARQLEITSANTHAKVAAAAASRKITANAAENAIPRREGGVCMLTKEKREKTKKDQIRRQRRREQQKTQRQQHVVEQQKCVEQQQQQQATLQKGVPANCAPLHDAFTHSDNTNKTTENLIDVNRSRIEAESVYSADVDSDDDDNDQEYDDYSDGASDNDSDSDILSDNDDDFDFGVTGIDNASTSQQQQSQVNTSNDYEPPRDLLLYLVRMGSFNSAPKINNVDSQDDSLEIPKGLSTTELLQHVKHLRGLHQPQLLTRYFVKPSLANDVTDGMRSLKLDTVARDYSTASTLPNHIRVLQWNILSQTLGQNNDGFVRCPEEALTWENRKFLIVQEILQNNPDVICLQEVDHFKFLQTILGTQNYEGIFFPKPDSPCLYIEENNGPDGCAIFYKRDKFELKSYDTRILEVWRVQSNQVAIVANLAVKATGKEFVVCTTHLKARHGALLSKLRNEQGRDLLRFVKQFAGQRPILICGDFNAEPTEPVYATVLSGEVLKLASAYADVKAERDECNNDSVDDLKMDRAELVKADAETAEENACNSNVVKSMQREPPYTTWKIREDGEECYTIDYVFYSPDQFKIRNCLEFPQDDEVGKNRTPSFQYPSDHFSLVCDLEILDKQ